MKIGDNISLETNEISINAENITIKSPEYKSKLNFGGIDIFFTKKFNWFNRLMLRLVFGLKIEKVDDK